MKKHFLIISTILLTLTVKAQYITLLIDSATHQITYTGVVTADSISADELFLRAKEWFVHSFNSAKDVTQMDDKERKKIIAKALFDVVTSYMGSFATNNLGYVKFSLEVQAKDGRYKYIFTDFWHEQGFSKAGSPGDLRLERPGGGLLTMGMKNWNGIKTQTDDFVKMVIKSLKEGMSRPSSSTGEW
ncbi:DUF4468 domain-containing protein [soil metagenome]